MADTSSSVYMNLICFLLTTLFYYMALKPRVQSTDIQDTAAYSRYLTNSYIYLGIYFLLVVMIQYGINASAITSKCGGNISDNMGIAGSMTIWPWTFIFGVVIIILLVYPGFKSAFSDVIGYYYVSNLANSVLTELLVDRKLQNEIDKTPMTPNKRRAMEDAADAILKICSNTAVIINQMVPSNFNAYWNILKPLMKAKYQDDSSEATQEIKSRLFEIVITRDNVGEAMWFMYTGFVITSIVQMRIAAQGCALTPATMEKNYQQFLEQEQQAKQQKELATSQVYTIT